MKVLGVVGPTDAGTTALVDRLTDRLAERGTVGTVRHLARAPDVDADDVGGLRDSAAAAATNYGLADDGDWIAGGSDASLDDALATLAPDHDYAIVEGFGDSDLPKVVLGVSESGSSRSPEVADGGRDHAGEALVEAADAASVDLDAVVEALEAVEPFETLGSLVARVERSPRADRAGAIATFTGRVRARDADDDPPTEYLEFEKYERIADERLARLERDLRDRDGVYEVELYHRTGVVERGEDVVHVVVLAGHRTEAFETVEDGIDRLKAEVPIFKKEVTADGEFWVHDRP